MCALDTFAETCRNRRAFRRLKVDTDWSNEGERSEWFLSFPEYPSLSPLSTTARNHYHPPPEDYSTILKGGWCYCGHCVEVGGSSTADGRRSSLSCPFITLEGQHLPCKRQLPLLATCGMDENTKRKCFSELLRSVRG